jgi:hypothetical protein
MGTFDLPVQLGGTRRQHEQGQASLLASQLEFGSEARPTLAAQGWSTRKGKSCPAEADRYKC